MSTLLFRFRYEVLGGHTHVRVYAGDSKSSYLGKCGDLVFRNEEWEAFKANLADGVDLGSIQIVKDDA